MCSEEVWDTLQVAMLERSKDRAPAVRVNAVRALARLQAPDDEASNSEPECPVIQEYLRLLASDASKNVRCAVLECLCVTRYTIGHIVARVRDVQPSVRKQAILTLAASVDIRALSIGQRVTILQNCLNDREASVQKACATPLLFNAWFGTGMKRNMVDLLEALDVVTYEDVSEKVVWSLLESLGGNLDFLIKEWPATADEMGVEKALLVRVAAEFATKKVSGAQHILLGQKLLMTFSLYTRNTARWMTS